MKKLSCTGRIHPFFAFFLVLLLAFPIGFYGLYLFIAPSLPDIAQLKSASAAIPLQVYSKDNKLVGEFGEKISYPVTYDEIPPLMVDSFLAAEDSSFFTHNGVSLKGLGRAISEALQSGRGQSGGSTITMQVAKNYYLSPERTLKRKLTEIFLARKIEQNLTKKEIFTLYVNKIFLGQHAYGIAAAAKVYYQKPLKDLTIAQMAMIAGLPKAPTKYNPVNDPERAIERRNWIIGRMLQLGFISQAQYQENINAPLDLHFSYNASRLDVSMPYVSEMVRDAMVREFGEDVLNSGYRVYTTIPSDRQQMAVDAVHKGLEAYDLRHGWRGAESNTKPLSDFFVINNLWPAQVTKVSERSFDAILGNGLTVTVPWSGMSWARRYHNTNSVGGAPQKASEIVQVKDIIRLRPDISEEQVRAIVYAKDKQTAQDTNKTTSNNASNKQTDNLSEKPESTSTIDASTNEKPAPIKTKWANINWALTQIPAAEAQLVSLDPNDGAIQAVVGGYDFARSNFNRSMQGWRQPGSNIKPFIYSLALERGFTPYSIINDAPLQIGSWRPQNSDSKFMGPITLRRALYLSRNLVSIRLLQAVGINRAIEHLSHFGFYEDHLPKNLTLALGTAQVVPIQLATGYAAFANGGYRIQPYFIDHVVNFRGDVLFKANPIRVCHGCEAPADQTNPNATDANGAQPIQVNNNPDGTISTIAPTNTNATDASATAAKKIPADYRKAERILTPKTAFNMANILRDVIQHGTGYAAMKLGRNDIGGKTGTTNDAKDAWFSGFSPNLVAVAWVGFDQPRTLGRKEFGGVAALPIWSDYMGNALANTPEGWFEQDISQSNPSPATAQKPKKIKPKKVTESTSSSESKPSKADDIEMTITKRSTSPSPSTPLESPF